MDFQADKLSTFLQERDQRIAAADSWFQEQEERLDALVDQRERAQTAAERAQTEVALGDVLWECEEPLLPKQKERSRSFATALQNQDFEEVRRLGRVILNHHHSLRQMGSSQQGQLRSWRQYEAGTEAEERHGLEIGFLSGLRLAEKGIISKDALYREKKTILDEIHHGVREQIFQDRTIVALEKTCQVVPAQWEGTLDTGEQVYIRYRGGHMRVDIPYGTEVYKETIGYYLDGSLSTQEMLLVTGFSLRPGVVVEEDWGDDDEIG